jgi:hypothetical protein
VANTIALSNKDDWHANLHQDELEAIMCNMFAVSTVTFVDAMNTFSLRAMMEPLLPVFPEFARGGRRQRD